jgi:hypothetical protein
MTDEDARDGTSRVPIRVYWILLIVGLVQVGVAAAALITLIATT